jgi:type II secretory pathway pseudopilin PulG
MKKNGFTLVELLAIILLLSVLITLVISNISAPLDSSNSTISDSRINVLLGAAKNYAEDNINNYAQCTFNKNLQDPTPCIINIRTLVNEGYIDEEEVLDFDSSYVPIACYNPDNTTITVFYKERMNANCIGTEAHRIYLDPQITSVYYQDETTITSNISLTGTFNSLICEVSPDNAFWVNWATCSISSDHKMLNVQFFGQENFPYTSSQSITIRVVGEYKDEQNNNQNITKNFRLVVFK